MEDGSNSVSSEAEVADFPKNGVVLPIMAKIPDGDNVVNSEDKVNHVDLTKVNGDNVSENNIYDNNDSYDSESDALVIDESLPKKRKSSKKPTTPVLVTENCDTPQEEPVVNTENEITDVIPHSNPFFNESLFELSQQHHNSQEEDIGTKTDIIDKNKQHKPQKRVKLKPKPKLKEYAQYLGLQPTVQFKCSKCGKAGFESLSTLHEHAVQCNAECVQETTSDNSTSGFKLTRKVFLCSACGTYYENWNLYMHMLEFHRRYICLYCLGMFSVLEDLCQHIQSRHNLEPGHRNSLDEFFNVYNEPCYVVCCECNKLFSEQDNFFYHSCTGKNNAKVKKPIRPQITPENHVTGESEATKSVVKDTEQSIDPVEKNMMDSEMTEVSENTEMLSKDVKCNNKETMLNKLKDDKYDGELNGSDKVEETDYSGENTRDNIDTKDMDEPKEQESSTETRKVPKLSLKLPKPGSYPEPEESDDSEKLTMEVDQIESETEMDIEPPDEQEVKQNIHQEVDQVHEDTEPAGDNEEKPNVETEHHEDVNEEPPFQVAGPEVPVMELELEHPLDKFDPKLLLQKCLKTTIASCIYCNHARKIAVNGRQLALHCIAEHRYSAIVNSITAEELIPESFVHRFRECLDELDAVFFNLESNFTGEAVTFSHAFECFQCYFSTTVHKELYLHNRKFHSKNLLLCIMCKSNFYSYSELVCHLCPGVYILDYDLQFRCCMCVNDDLPSAFRLMVHLRKRHNVCDVCLEMCHTQYRLSNHVWKHKLHHFCYRCGIAYRNKPDITRHLFWKHGTESMLCKRCLQKKWPHVYHFCVPPASFTCDECGGAFTRAVALKVHKRLHTDEKKHACTFEGCTETFISKKLVAKHEQRHREPPPPQEEVKPDVEDVKEEAKQEENVDHQPDVNEQDKVEDKPKAMIDVLDLPALNLSESDSSDSETEGKDETPVEEKSETVELSATRREEEPTDEQPNETTIITGSVEEEPIKTVAEEQPAGNQESKEPEDATAVIQDIWDNFKNYQASKEKLDNMFGADVEKPEKPPEDEIPVPMVEETPTMEVALVDHDYCLDPEKRPDTSIIEVEPALSMTESVDHDYCTAKAGGTVAAKPPLEPLPDDPPPVAAEGQKAKKPSDSSSSSSGDSDSSNCSCGSNCSCSSSSGSSSSSSDSSGSDSSTEEGRQRQAARRQKRKERAKNLKEKEKEKEAESENKVVDVVATNDPLPVIIETPINESDLDTTESETDEEFYDKAPQKLAKRILEEKRQQLLALMGPNSVPTVPNGSFIESTSRPPTPPAGSVVEEEEERKHKKSKSKKRKKRRNERREQEEKAAAAAALNIIADVPIPPYYQQFHQQQAQQQQESPLPAVPSVPPLTLSLSRLSPAQQPRSPAAVANTVTTPKLDIIGSDGTAGGNVRASKRRRVPNKFYGYSSDEEDKEGKGHTPGSKWKKMVGETPSSPLTVPPITIKAPPPVPPPAPPPQPTVEPISIRTAAHLSDFRVKKPRHHRKKRRRNDTTEDDDSDATNSDLSDSSEDDRRRNVIGHQAAVPGAVPSAVAPGQAAPGQPQPQLYCYCRCPYDEVSEMIGCDASDCAIEWFHFECVGIMVPPKGQWFCPDCRKKKQQRQLMQQSMH